MTDPTRHPTHGELQEWLDGEMGIREAARVAGHVADCKSCSGETAQIRSLLASLGSLPRGLAPPEDVRENARGRIEQAEVLPLEARRDRAPRRRIGLAAAAIGLLLVGATAGLLLGPGGDRGAGPGTPDPAATALRSVAADYDRAVADLAAALEARRSDLDPATVRIVEENLRVVDGAIREASEALAADPANPVLREFVVAGYEQKLDLLRRATGPAAEL